MKTTEERCAEFMKATPPMGQRINLAIQRLTLAAIYAEAGETTLAWDSMMDLAVELDNIAHDARELGALVHGD